MKNDTKIIIEKLKSEFGVKPKIQAIDDSDKDFDVITIQNNKYVINKGLTESQQDDVASYIYANLTDSISESCTNASDVIVNEALTSLSEVEKDKVYKYVPSSLNDNINTIDDAVNNTEGFRLAEIAKSEPYCKVKDILIVSKNENDGFVLVDFNIDENKDNENLSEDLIKDTYVVFPEDLVNVSTKVEEDIDYTASDNKIETSTALLTALNSEKEAVIIYEMLLKLSIDEEEKKLLSKILEDEKEHIALLSGLQSSKTADSVAEDNKELLDSYAEDIIDTPTPVSESLDNIINMYSKDGYVPVENISNYVTEIYDGDIDDRYDCIISLMNDYESEGKVSIDIIDQYAGAHNLVDKIFD